MSIISFADNYFEADPPGPPPLGSPDKFKDLSMVVLAGSSIIATQNHIRWTSFILDAIHIHISGDAGYTVLGNIYTGFIRIGGAELGDPWKPLNVRVRASER